jgi:type I restriction enzyme S subunit
MGARWAVGMISHPNEPLAGVAVRRFKPHSAYKDSGVEWLGEIPVQWKVRRLKFVAHIEAGQSPASEGVTESFNGLPFLQGNAEFGPLNPVPSQVCDSAPKRAEPDDILLSVRAPVGALNVADRAYGIGRGLCAIKPADNVDRQFSFYLLSKTRFWLDVVATGSTYDAVTTAEVGDLPALLPPLPEQHAIAAFLDRETARIDALIAEKKRLIDLLNEQRASLITRAVTRGLDPSMPMKDSGVEWLGTIPSHWSVSRLKHVVDRTVDCPHETPVYCDDGDYLVLRTADVREGVLDLTAARRVEEAEYRKRIRRLDLSENDIVYSREGERFGMAALVPAGATACLGQRMMQFRIGFHSIPRFVMWQLNSLPTYRQASLDITGATSPHVNVETIRNFWLSVPPPAEQAEIAAHLDEATIRIDGLIGTVRDAIRVLLEYRSALVSAAVTGKIDVREEVA